MTTVDDLSMPLDDSEHDLADPLSLIPRFAADEDRNRLADRRIDFLQRQLAPAARASDYIWQRSREQYAPENTGVH